MIPSAGGGGRNHPNRGGTLRRREPPQPLPSSRYQPILFRYSCHGVFAATTTTATESIKVGREGHCMGWKGRLEMLGQLEENSRSGALRTFGAWTDDGLMDIQGAEPSASTEQHQTKEIAVSPALIYKEDESSKEDLLPEEEFIKRQRWTCYGSTDVEYLVLKDTKTGKETVAALAPHTLGLSHRVIEQEDGTVFRRVGLGPLTLDITAEQSVMPPQEEVPDKPPADALEPAKEAVQRTAAFSLRVIGQMKKDARWLTATLSDDFPSRMVKAGKKIAAKYPETVKRTSHFSGKLMKRMLFSDDDDEGET